MMPMSERTTLTLEDDVAERLRDEARRTGRSFKDVVNGTIRNGLDRAPEQAAPYRSTLGTWAFGRASTSVTSRV